VCSYGRRISLWGYLGKKEINPGDSREKDQRLCKADSKRVRHRPAGPALLVLRQKGQSPWGGMRRNGGGFQGSALDYRKLRVGSENAVIDWVGGGDCEGWGGRKRKKIQRKKNK